MVKAAKTFLLLVQLLVTLSLQSLVSIRSPKNLRSPLLTQLFPLTILFLPLAAFLLSSCNAGDIASSTTEQGVLIDNSQQNGESACVYECVPTADGGTQVTLECNGLIQDGPDLVDGVPEVCSAIPLEEEEPEDPEVVEVFPPVVGGGIQGGI